MWPASQGQMGWERLCSEVLHNFVAAMKFILPELRWTPCNVQIWSAILPPATWPLHFPQFRPKHALLSASWPFGQDPALPNCSEGLPWSGGRMGVHHWGSAVGPRNTAHLLLWVTHDIYSPTAPCPCVCFSPGFCGIFYWWMSRTSNSFV